MDSWFDPNKLAETFNKVKNAVLNLPEYQCKVLEATGNEHWGASSTLMLDIAHATGNPQHFNDVMSTIYQRVQEPAGPTWRQTYKALQLLEYLIKNGNERVVDYAKDHIYELKALKNFHYTDEKGKDQGINVRNRGNEIVVLLGDNDRIKEERKKARENRSKYTGVSSSGGGFGGSGNKYGGFAGGGSSNYQEDYSSGGGYSSRNESNYGGNISSVTASARETGRSDYSATSSASVTSSSSNSRALPKVVFKSDGASASTAAKPATSSVKAQQTPTTTAAPIIDLLGTDDLVSTATAASGSNDDWGDFASATITTAQPVSTASASAGFADFASFQSAPVSNSNTFTSFAAPVATQSATTSSFDDFGDFTAASSTTTAVPNFANFGGAPSSSQSGGISSLNNQFASFNMNSGASANTNNGFSDFNTFNSTPVKSGTGNDAFSKLVSLDPMALSGVGKKDNVSGPSLSSIQNSHTQFGGVTPSGGFSQGGAARPPSMVGMGVMSPMGVTPVKPQQTQQQNQKSSGGFGDFDSLI
ncbi:Epsin-3, clathrin recruitment and traffic between the Golgi and endosome [Rhizoclosmatium sp. JEL0117]|nr:Epsin-3, clathrin recruitment and traffic between the Golgi and endosome [Rhizoclosmatium sp. JEL0117]